MQMTLKEPIVEGALGVETVCKVSNAVGLE